MHTMSSKKISVGISVFAVEGANLWSNGLNQNIAFLIALLRQSDRIGRIVLLNGGNVDCMPKNLDFGWPDIPLVSPQDVTFDLDLVIEMGAQLPLEWLRRVRALGTKIVTFFVGHCYADLGESPMFGTDAGYTFHGTPWHEVWTLPHHMKASGPLLRTLTRAPVHAMPHIWSPVFIERRICELRADGFEFGFRSPTAREPLHAWRAAIFEPNISVVKNYTIPMLVCESAYRQRRESVELMMVMNAVHMKEHMTFNRFASHLGLTKDGRASYEPRLDFVDAMARRCMNVVVSHQWECGMNYLYYDALYGGYPLVHNSEFLRRDGVGLYYPGFEAGEGGKQLVGAIEEEAGYWDDYAASAKRLIYSVLPWRESNVRAYIDRIVALVETAVTP